MTTPIPPVGFTTPVSAVSAAQPAASASTGGANFASAIGNGLDAVQNAQATADTLAVQAATGNLQDISQYTVAATKAQVMTEFAAAMRTKAIDAFNTIMSMQA